MTRNEQRPILRLKKKGLVDPEDDKSLEVCLYDVLLPCRLFMITHKVAELGSVSITTEFLLRLLKILDKIKEDDIAEFFGFNQREMSYVLSEAENNGYIARHDGAVTLTVAGQVLFPVGANCPEIYVVESRRESIGFDLIAFAPEERRFLDKFELRLPELDVLEPENVSAASRVVQDAFRRFYGEIVVRRQPTAAASRSLYSIDHVEPHDRFHLAIRILVKSTSLRPSVAVPDLSLWRTDGERNDRQKVIEAASRFVDSLSVQRRPDMDTAYQVMTSLAPEFFKEFTGKEGLFVDRYYREALTRAGDIRADRPTAPILGAVFTKENTRRLFDVVHYGVKRAKRRQSVCIWFMPQSPHWGATTALQQILELLRANAPGSANDNTLENPTTAIAMCTGRAPKHIESAFDVVGSTNNGLIPDSLEILLIPGTLAAVTVHAPIGTMNGVPVPLGFVSFEPEIVSRTQSFVVENMGAYTLPDDVVEKIRSACASEPSGAHDEEGGA